MALTRLGTNAITSVPSSAITALPAGVGGKVLQVVQNISTTTSATSGTSFVNTNLNATITPSSTSSKILVSCTQLVQVYNTSGNYGTGRWKIVQTINGTSTDVNVGGTVDNGNVFCFDYGGSGINIFRPTNLTVLTTPNTTSAITYKTQIAKGTSGGNAIYCFDADDTARMVLLEIAG